MPGKSLPVVNKQRADYVDSGLRTVPAEKRTTICTNRLNTDIGFEQENVAILSFLPGMIESPFDGTRYILICFFPLTASST